MGPTAAGQRGSLPILFLRVGPPFEVGEGPPIRTCANEAATVGLKHPAVPGEATYAEIV